LRGAQTADECEEKNAFCLAAASRAQSVLRQKATDATTSCPNDWCMDSAKGGDGPAYIFTYIPIYAAPLPTKLFLKVLDDLGGGRRKVTSPTVKKLWTASFESRRREE